MGWGVTMLCPVLLMPSRRRVDAGERLVDAGERLVVPRTLLLAAHPSGGGS